MTSVNSRRRFGADEDGQISVLLLLGLIPVVFLLALVFNTAKQTSRKVQMQNAADAAAVSGAVWMARGMNLTVLNNNGMAEVLSAMIVIRSMRWTIVTMNRIVIPPLLPFIEIPVVAAYIAFLRGLEVVFTRVDAVLNANNTGAGWAVMKALDKLNQAIKASIPLIVQAQAMDYARQNGADRLSFIVSGARGASLADFLPLMPVGRGGTRAIVERAEECQLPKLATPAQLFLAVIYPPLAVIEFNLLVRQNVFSLKSPGGGFPFPPPLRWPNDPPRPMILTDQPRREAAARTDTREEFARLWRVRRFLQLLMIARGSRPLASGIGGTRFPNETPVWLGEEQFTYGQADVYNPTHWGMFTQDWRAQLAKASMFEEKKDALANKLGLGGLRDYIDWSFINTH